MRLPCNPTIASLSTLASLSDLATLRSLASSHAIASAKFALDKQFIENVDLQFLISYLENSLDSSTASVKEITSIISSSLDIPAELLNLSKDDVKVITNYLSTCKLMIDCSKQASGLSAQQWEAIKQRMLLPKS